ncbi:helix-turn-helix transcriptional regulator [Sporosalibacterium faouarense]|uniref:helix-turn-helix transcriptional regulator n=1 Tax=Sporosalibacterium faouarense TaxID=516123 RepID=UPI00141CA7EC|nr:helix-turn-helix transcriptional regulator [Sporosalibacterium faouarense]MTI48445.1 helix-turn-helix transcriptional regulator [Bacillota bacterium]
MNTNLDILWKKIHDFTLSCGRVHEPKAFSTKILSSLDELCNFDQSLIYFLDGNGKVYNQYLMNIDKRWSTMYLEYYSKTKNCCYSLERNFREDPDKPTINIKAWEKEPSTEFITDYIRSRGLKYSLGFALYDLNGMPRTIFSLDKTKNESFTDDEFMTLYLIVPILNNLHKNFFYQQKSSQGVEQISWDTTSLTPREIEIANLLCQGISPSVISKLLYISQSTTYKHISNIYEKMHVSTLQELLVRLLG